MPSERTIEDLFHNLPSPSSDFEQRAKLMTALDDTAKLKLAVEALEHYANDSNWQPIVKGRITTDIYAGTVAAMTSHGNP